jgi:NAD(P)-dependent dehydrogenase (short-subunit alcohol dehydrogenase family)
MGVLSGQRAIVIGGSSGLGLGTARLLARDGAHVTLAARTEDKLQSATELLAGEGLTVSWARCDGTSPEDVRAAVETASEDGKLHIAVVVPGGGPPRGVLLYGDDEFSELVDLNIRPVYLLLKHAGAAMVRAGGGSFVAVSSTVTAFSFRYLAAYSAGKAAVDQLIRVAANELGAAGVRVNGVRPGLTRTPGTSGFFDHPEYVEEFLAGQAIPRPGEVDDIAQAIRFFAGPESSWITGQLLTVDGGHTLRAAPDMKEMFNLEDQVEVVTQSRAP